MGFIVVLAVPRVSPIGGRVVCPQPDDAGALRRVEDTTVLIAGVEHRGITLVPHDPAWAGRLAVERSRIRATLSDRAVRADHVGSTAVPGLAAKPIVDIDLGVTNVEDESAYLPDLLAAGYELRVASPATACSAHPHYTSTPRVRRGQRVGAPPPGLPGPAAGHRVLSTLRCQELRPTRRSLPGPDRRTQGCPVPE